MTTEVRWGDGGLVAGGGRAEGGEGRRPRGCRLCSAVAGRRRRRGWRRRPTGANGGGLGGGVGGPWVTLPRERRGGEGPVPT